MRPYRAAVLLTLLAALGFGRAAAAPYTDPALLDVPWGRYSLVKQAWRGYLETVPAVDYLDGLGVVWSESVPGKTEDRMAEELAWAGFRRVRIEVPWGAVKHDETGFEDAGAVRLARLLRALQAHGLRPLILLNANHLQPCPVEWRELRVESGAPAGSRSITVLGDLAGVLPRTATLMTLADGVRPGPMIESAGAGTRRQAVQLSKGLPRAVKSGEILRLAILKYQPLYPVGTQEFERTAAGWLRYVQLAASFVQEHYGGAFDVEVWNEFTFGSAFLDIGNYVDAPATSGAAPEAFHRGGRIWELANRTVQAMKRDYPDVHVIWGFSSTSFFHVKIPELPPYIDGQSYHPYGTGRRCYADAVRGKETLLLDGVIPPGCLALPEGWAHTWFQTESLVRLLAPAVRGARPPGSAAFQHFITEHGFDPDEIDVGDVRDVRRAKEKFLLRAPLLWLNKGIDALYVYDAYDRDERGFGMFEAGGGVSGAMRSLHELTNRLAGATKIAAPRPLTIAVRAAGAVPGARAEQRPSQDDLLAVLPFQVTGHKFALGVYVMTQDFPADLAPQPYTITISGVRGSAARVAYFSPESAGLEPVTVVARAADEITVALAVTDVPRLLEIDETPAAAGTGGVP